MNCLSTYIISALFFLMTAYFSEAQLITILDTTLGNSEFTSGYSAGITLFDYNGTSEDYYLRQATAFSVPEGTYDLHSLLLPIFWYSGTQGLGIYLYTDQNGLPGSSLGLLSDPNFIWPDLSNLTATTVIPPDAIELIGGESYWIVAQIDTDGAPSEYRWNLPSFNYTTVNASSIAYQQTSPSGDWFLPVSIPDFGIAVNVVAVPEPTSTAMFLLGAFAIAFMFTRRTRLDEKAERLRCFGAVVNLKPYENDNIGEQQITIGMDLGDRKHAYCVLDGDGEMVKSDTGAPVSDDENRFEQSGPDNPRPCGTSGMSDAGASAPPEASGGI